MSLMCAPGRQKTSLWVGPSLCIGSSVPMRRESPIPTTLLFLLTKEVLAWGRGVVALGGSTLPQGPSPISSVLWPSGSRAPHLLQKVPSPPCHILRRNLLPDLLPAFIFGRPLANSPLTNYPAGFWVHHEDATDIFLHGIFWISLFLITISTDKNSNLTSEKPVF